MTHEQALQLAQMAPQVTQFLWDCGVYSIHCGIGAQMSLDDLLVFAKAHKRGIEWTTRLTSPRLLALVWVNGIEFCAIATVDEAREAGCPEELLRRVEGRQAAHK